MDILNFQFYAGSTVVALPGSLANGHPVFYWMEVARVILYFFTSIAMALFAVSAKVHNDRIWLLWTANAIYYSAMLYLLALNQVVPDYAYQNRDLLTIPLLLVVMAAAAELWRQYKLSKTTGARVVSQ